MKTAVRVSIILTLNIIVCVNDVFCLTICGFVVDGSNGEPLPMATVMIANDVLGSTTNLDGYFVIDVNSIAEYPLHVTYLGFKSEHRVVNVTDTLMPPLVIELQPAIINLEEAVILSEREKSSTRRKSPQISTEPLDSKILRLVPSLMGEMDMLRSLQMIPGVKSSSELSSALYIRGGSPDQTLIMMDHNTIYNPTHMFGLFSTFNTDAVKYVNLIKGGFPAEYEGRSGSVLEVITDEGNRKRTEGSFLIGFVSARASLQGPLSNNTGSYAVSFRRTIMDPIIDVMRKTTESDLPDYYFYDFNGKINIDLTPRSTFSFSGYNGHDRLTYEFGAKESGLNARISWGNSTMAGRYRLILGKNLYFSLSGATSQYKSYLSFKNASVTLLEGENRLKDYSIKLDLEFLGSQKHRLKTGMLIKKYDYGVYTESESINYADFNGKSQTLAVYVQDNSWINHKFEIQSGIRGYFNSAGKHQQLDPRFSMVYHYSSELRLKMAIGRYTQLINVATFSELFSNFDVWIPLHKSRQPSYSNQAILGIEYDFTEFDLTAEIYNTEMKNLTSFDVLALNVKSPSEAFITGNGRANGIEITARRNNGRFTGLAGYTFALTSRQFTDTYLNVGNAFYPRWDRRHEFALFSSYKLTQFWDFSAAWNYKSGRGYTKEMGYYTFVTPRIGYQNVHTDVLFGNKNGSRFPVDHRLDVSLVHKHNFHKNPNFPAKLSISLYNVYNRRSYWLRYVEVDPNSIEITNAKLLPFTPMISYEVKY